MDSQVLSKNSFFRKYFLFFIVFIVIGLDQATKAVLSHYLSDFQSITVIPNVFYLTLVHNTGIAFGLFKEGSWLLLIAIFIGIIILIYLASQSKRRTFLSQLSFGFVLGGAFGNLTDRLLKGAVTDFLDFRIWPVFNLADSFITIGVCLLVISILKQKNA